MRPWNDWYHVNGNTYGTWLRGDPRGWRARHHREHVDGDYKNAPAPGTYGELHRIAKKDSARALSDAKLVGPGGVWAVRFRCLAIRDRAHQVNVFRYIESHADRGTAVWSFHDTVQGTKRL